MEASRLWRYGIAVLCVAVGVALRLVVDPVIGSGQVLFAFMLAIMATGRIAGRGPALLASALSVPLAWYIFFEPRYSFRLAHSADVGSLVVLAIVGAGISLLSRHPALSSPLARDRRSGLSFLRRALLFGLPFLVLAVFARILHSDFAREKERQQWVTHSYQVLNAIQALLSNLQDAETGQRGYLLTADQRYLEPYQSALRAQQSLRQTLRQLTAGNQAQQARLDTVDRLVAAKFAIVQKTVALRQEVGLEAALAVIRTDAGKQIMDECRALLGAMADEDRQLLATRTGAADAQDMRMRWIMGLGSGSLLMLLVIAHGVIERDIGNRERVRHAVSQNEERLRLALDAANAGTWDWNLETNENVWSEELWNLYGLEPYSCTPSYEAWREVVHPDDRANAEELVAQAARTASELNLEFRVCDRFGTERWLLSRGRPLRDAAGRAARFVGIVVDITGRKRAEDAMREREQSLQRFAEVAPVAIAMFDNDMRYLAASRRFRDDYSLGDQELVGRSHYDVFPEIPEQWREVHRKCLAGAVERSPEEPFLRADGTEQWIRWEIQPWRHAGGAIGGIVLFSEEITANKRSEQALRESEARLRLAQQVARVGTFEWNIQTGVNTWTPELEAIYGLPPGGFGGTEEAWELLVHPGDRQQATRQVEQAMETGKFEAEWRVIWPDGTLRWLAGRAWVFKDAAEKPLRLIGVNIDITEAKRAGEELGQASEQRRLALEAAQLGAWDYHFDTGDVFWDDACCHMFEVPPGRISDEEALSRIHSEDRPAVRESLGQALAGANNGSYHHEFRVRWADGTVHWIVSHGRVQFGEKGGLRRALRFTGVNTDITERKQAELEIRQLNSELEKRVRERTVQLEIANKELESFAYSVSHDLRAPLRGIDGWSLALAEDYAAQLDQRAHGYIDRVRSETQRMGFLIDAMLQLSRVSRADMQLVPVNFTDAARTIASRLSEANSSRAIEFVIEPGLYGIADARLLEIALTNLLANAVKFTAVRAQSRIEFGQASHNGQPAFYVRDNGVGFDMTYAGKLFSAFHRLHKTSEFPGTGIGLATVQRVIHRHAGRVWAEAQVDRGATFYFTIGETL